MIDAMIIEQVKDSANIEDIVGEYVNLKRRGVNYIGLCPFHNEKTPSFTVSPSKGICKCFGCGGGGNVFNFIMQIESLSFVESVRFLAKKYGIEIEEKEETPEEKEAKNLRESMMVATDFADKHFQKNLWETKEGKAIGLEYFRHRELRDDIVKKFNLGYALEEKTAFTKFAQKKGYKLSILTACGLTIQRENWKIDRFAGRVIFPIHSVSGRTIGFGGRIMKTSDKTAKYLNSPESDIYHKSRVLYGIFQAKKAITQNDKCFLVEGYTDVISMHQSGIDNVVASSGTALTEDQIRLIKRFTNNVTVIYDGDAAGIKASMRGIDMLLQQGMHVKIIALPEGDDPDSFAKSRSASDLAEFIRENELDFIKFKTKLLLGNTENDPYTKTQAIKSIIESIAQISDPLARSEYISTCSVMLDRDEKLLYDEVVKIIHKKTDDFQKRKYIDSKRQTFIQNKPTQPYNKETLISSSEEPEIKAILRVAIKFFFEYIAEDENGKPINVATFILNELIEDELIPQEEPFASCFRLLTDILNEDILVGTSAEDFMTHNVNNGVATLCIEILSEKYTESKRWSDKKHFHEDEKDILHSLVPRLINEYKLKCVKGYMTKLEGEISKLNNECFDKAVELQKEYQKLRSIASEISKRLDRPSIS
ncbi:MAG: DNA primase [Bacteroidales bacterium]